MRVHAPSVAIRSPTRSGSTSVEIAAEARIACAITSGGVSRDEYASSKSFSEARSVCVTSDAKTTSSLSACESSSESATRSPTLRSIVAGSVYSCSPINGSCQSRFGRKTSSGRRPIRNSSSSSRRSTAAITPASAPADVPKIHPTRGQSSLSARRFRKPASISTPLIAPPERTTATSRSFPISTGCTTID